MARKGGARRSGAGANPTAAPKQRRVTEDDMSDDEVDSFHEQRDKILLDGDKHRQDVGGSDRFDALGGARGVLEVDEAESDSDEDVADEDEDDDDDGADDEEAGLTSVPSTKSKKQSTVAAAAQDDSSDDEDIASQMDEEEDAVGGWGPNKRAYYNTNDLDDLESDSEMDEDEKREMELAEVKKLQKRSRQGMVEKDFGLGDQEADAESGVAAREQRRKDLDIGGSSQASKSTASFPAAPLNPAELIAKIQKETPETMALIGEFADMVQDMNNVTNRMKLLQEANPDHPSLGLLHLHHQTLLTYVTTLAFYFYLRASPSHKAGSSRVSQSTVVERLAKLKQGLSALEDFGLGTEDDEEEEEEGEDDEEVEDELDDGDAQRPINFLFKPASLLKETSSDEGSESMGSLEDDELMQLDAEEKENVSAAQKAKANVKHSGNPTNGLGSGKAKQSAKSVGKENKKSKTKASSAAPLAGLLDLINDDAAEAESVPPSKRRKQASRPAFTDSEAYDAFGEPTALTSADQADKEATRRSLKFYTGQIDAREGRKAGRQLDGDLDIPYRDKERSRMAVAATNQSKVAKANGAARRQLDADDFGEEDAQAWRDVMDAEGDIGEAGSSAAAGTDGDYYDLLTNSRKAAKEASKAQYDEERMAKRIAPEDALEAGEHRAINRQIEKNRGLTPRRPKSVRNPRVKKRQRYEKAQKKLSSQGPVYKGGQAALQGGYGGEKSGISSHVVKSRQFAS